MSIVETLRPVDTAEHQRHVRSPVDVLRLVTGAVLLVGGVLSANLLDSALLGLSDDGAQALDSLPDWFDDVPAVGIAFALIAAAAFAAGWALVTTRFRRLAMLVAAFVVAAVLSVSGGVVFFAAWWFDRDSHAIGELAQAKVKSA